MFAELQRDLVGAGGGLPDEGSATSSTSPMSRPSIATAWGSSGAARRMPARRALRAAVGSSGRPMTTADDRRNERATRRRP